MKAKVIKPFSDKVEGVIRNIGDSFDVSAERFKEINSTQFGCLAVAEETVKPTKKKSTKKK